MIKAQTGIPTTPHFSESIGVKSSQQICFVGIDRSYLRVDSSAFLGGNIAARLEKVPLPTRHNLVVAISNRLFTRKFAARS
jgi:hypothetical protein